MRFPHVERHVVDSLIDFMNKIREFPGVTHDTCIMGLVVVLGHALIERSGDDLEKDLGHVQQVYDYLKDMAYRKKYKGFYK